MSREYIETLTCKPGTLRFTRDVPAFPHPHHHIPCALSGVSIPPFPPTCSNIPPRLCASASNEKGYGMGKMESKSRHVADHNFSLGVPKQP